MNDWKASVDLSIKEMNILIESLEVTKYSLTTARIRDVSDLIKKVEKEKLILESNLTERAD